MKPVVILSALLLGCATAEPAKEAQPDMVPAAEVAQATAELIAAGQKLLEQRNEALDLAERLQKALLNCQAARSA